MNTRQIHKKIAALAAFFTVLANVTFASAAVTLDVNGDGVIRVDDVVKNVQLQQDVDGSGTFDKNDISGLLQQITSTKIQTGTIIGKITGHNMPIGGATLTVDGVLATYTTLADGTFSIPNMSALMAYKLVVSATGYDTATVTFDVPVTGGTFSIPDIVLTPVPVTNGTTVTGQVYDLNGIAFGGAAVSVSDGSMQIKATTTDSLGKYTVSSLQEGMYTATVTSASYGTNIIAFNAVAGANVQLPTQLLPPTGQTLGSIAGAVFQNGVPASHAYVSVSNTTYSAYTDDQGRFVLANMPMADYTVNIMSESASATLPAQLNSTSPAADNPYINLGSSSVRTVSTASELIAALDDSSVSTIQLLNDINYSGTINFTRELELIADTNRTLTANNFTGEAVSTSNVVLTAAVGSDVTMLNQALSGLATQISVVGIEGFIGTLYRTSGSNPFFKNRSDSDTQSDSLQKAFVNSAISLVGAFNDPNIRTIYITGDIEAPDSIAFPSRFIDVRGLVPLTITALFTGTMNGSFTPNITIKWPTVITDVTETDTLHKGMPIYVASNMPGTVYLVTYGTSRDQTAITANLIASQPVIVPGVPVTFDTSSLTPGQEYGIYAVDESGHVSAISSKINLDDAPYVVQTGGVQFSFGDSSRLPWYGSDAVMRLEFSAPLDSTGRSNVEAAFKGDVDPVYDPQDAQTDENKGMYLNFDWYDNNLDIRNEISDYSTVSFPTEVSASLRAGDPASVLFNVYSQIMPYFLTSPDAGEVNVLKVGFDHQLEKTTTSNTDINSILSSLDIGDAARIDQVKSLSWDLTDVQHPILNIWLKDGLYLDGQVNVDVGFWDGVIRGTGGAYIPEMYGIYLLTY
jgi:hypothetical protein